MQQTYNIPHYNATSMIFHRNDGSIFHFTTADAFWKILDNLCLKPSAVSNLNDLNEVNLYNYYSMNVLAKKQIDEYIKKNCYIVCFSQNYKQQIGDNQIYQSGINRPSMWAYYGGNNSGVCIVLNEQKLKELNKNILCESFYQFQNVKYEFHNAYGDLDYTLTPIEFVRKYYERLFFTKHIDWHNEDERRLMINNDNGQLEQGKMLNIDGAISYIVLGRKFIENPQNIDRILDLVTDSQSKCYHKFIPHSFATVCYSEYGYRTNDCASMFMMKLDKNVSYKEYKLWLVQNFKYAN